MSRIYLDNAATTPIDPEVFEEMKPYFLEKFGNPSSIYSYGRETRLAIENARKAVARIINAHPSEIFFTSGGTESANTAIHAAVYDLGCKRIITSPLEHHATLHTVETVTRSGDAVVSFVKIDQQGRVDLADLRNLLSETKEKCLVALMHANNEIGTLLDVEEVARICEEFEAIFYSDTVQTLAHFPIDVKKFKVHFLSGAAHKFHGPKGVGMLYVNREVKVHPYIQGGAQERNMRAGTENVYGIVGFAKALQLAVENMDAEKQHIVALRDYMKQKLQQLSGEICFNGDHNGHCLYTVLSVGFPKNEKTDMLLFQLDLHNICVSGGSACSSGAVSGSHVISALPDHKEQVTIRFSFSKYNTREEVDKVIDVLKTVI